MSRDVLAACGLEEVWYTRLDEPIETVYLIDAGLFVVSPPEGSSDRRVLKMLSLRDGLSVWHETVDGPITDPPFAYRYPAGVQKSPELIFRIHDTVHCLDLQYGALLWKKTMPPPISTPVIADENHIFFGTDSSRILAVTKGQAVDDWVYLTRAKLSVAPVFNSGLVVFASHDGFVYGMTPENGWVNLRSWKTETFGPILADIAQYSRWVFAGSTDYKLYCIEGRDGRVYWSFAAEGPIEAPPVVFRYRTNQEYVYCIAKNNPLVSSRETRTLFAIPLPKASVVTRGTHDWRRENVLRVVTMGKDTLYVLNDPATTGERTISGLDVKTGREKLKIPVEGFNFLPTNHADAGRDASQRGRIYLISTSGSIQVIGEKP
ncbi:MAG: PQQ-binding-like beta-propeller repeat protein [Planctomycetes bacterium]|nr:PQQ-binding-like beta-propeller repeat protein [Planctomycetota bacterium]